MKKYFVMSDIHSFFDQMLSALTAAGFDKNNHNHNLIICGDIFDRGNQTVLVYNFIKSLPSDRVILIQGNHELLYFELLDKDIPDKYDFSNGTVKTFCHIAGYDPMLLDTSYLYYKSQQEGKKVSVSDINNTIKATWKKIRSKVKRHEITKWLKSEVWNNYYELGDLIFVHSFLPTKVKDNLQLGEIKYYPANAIPEDFIELAPDWREKASKLQWDDAKWGCPWKQFNAGLFNSEMNQGKTLVCGHWHTSDFHRKFEADMSNNLNIFYSDVLIALDACTAASGFCNVLVLDFEAGLCYDQRHKILGGLK